MACPSVSSLLPPLLACPETSKDNPWHVAQGFFSDDGLYHISSSSAFKVESLEFYPNREAYPNCYFRFLVDSVAGNRIPKEMVLLPSGEAATILATLAKSSGFSQVSVGSMGSTELLFESSADLKAPFFAKAVKAVLKMFVAVVRKKKYKKIRQHLDKPPSSHGSSIKPATQAV